MATFNALQILDKTLYSKKNLIAYMGSPGSTNTFKIAPNQMIGRVYSYVYPKDKSAVYWMFFTGNDSKNGKVFYVPHEEGAFDLKVLKEQGTKTVEQQVQEKQDKEDLENKGTFRYYVDKWAAPVAVGTGILYIAGQVIKVAFNDKK